MINEKYISINTFKLILFLTFIDPFLFTIHRTLRYLGVIDSYYDQYKISDFTFTNYFFLIFVCLIVFIMTLMITKKLPRDLFKIKISKTTFYIFLLLLLIFSIYLFDIQQTYRPRYRSGSITTFPGFINLFNRTLLICLFVIYQLNRSDLDKRIFILILICSILMSDGLAGGATFLSLVAFEFYRYSLKKKIYSFIIYGVISIFVMDLVLSYKYSFNSVSEGFTFFSFKYSGYEEQFYNYFIPRIATHAEQLYSYLNADLDISNYFYLYNIIVESFQNRLKVIFDYGEIFYPKTVAQSIVFSIQDIDAPGGSSPGYVLSVISFLPFTIFFVIIIALLLKQVSFRIGEKLNFIQIAGFFWIIKMISSNFLDMLAIIEPALVSLIFVYISSNVYIKNKIN